MCHGVEEAGCKTAQAAVTERRIGFLRLDGIQVAAHLLDGVGNHVAHAEVEQVVVEQAPNQEFDGEVVHALFAFSAVACICIGRDIARLVCDNRGKCVEVVDIARLLELLARDRANLLSIRLDELFLRCEYRLHVPSPNGRYCRFFFRAYALHTCSTDDVFFGSGL